MSSAFRRCIICWLQRSNHENIDDIDASALWLEEEEAEEKAIIRSAPDGSDNYQESQAQANLWNTSQTSFLTPLVRYFLRRIQPPTPWIDSQKFGATRGTGTGRLDNTLRASEADFIFGQLYCSQFQNINISKHRIDNSVSNIWSYQKMFNQDQLNVIDLV